MTIDGAVIKEQGVTFAIAIVKPSAITSPSLADETRASIQRYFPGLPLIMASQDSQGRFSYQGRRDIVGFLASIDPSRIPWMRYTIT